MTAHAEDMVLVPRATLVANSPHAGQVAGSGFVSL